MKIKLKQFIPNLSLWKDADFFEARWSSGILKSLSFVEVAKETRKKFQM